MHIQTAARRAQFITISNPITRFKEQRNYSLSSDNLLSARVWSALRRSTGIRGYFEFQSANSFYIYHVYVCPNETGSVSLFPRLSGPQTSILHYCFSQLGLGLLQHRSSKKFTSPENQDRTCLIWHFLTIGRTRWQLQQSKPQRRELQTLFTCIQPLCSGSLVPNMLLDLWKIYKCQSPLQDVETQIFGYTSNYI